MNDVTLTELIVTALADREGAEGLEAVVFNPAQFTATGIEQPAAALVPAGRMGHGKPRHHHAVAGQVEQHPASAPFVAPAGGAGLVTAGARPHRLIVLQAHAVEVAGVFSRLPRQEWGLP